MEDEIASPLRFRHTACNEIDSQVNLCMEALGITHLSKRQIRGLSGGEKVLVALATALVNHPRLLILDECDSHLDADQADSSDLVIRKSDVPYIISCTQDMERASRGDHLVYLENGSVCFPAHRNPSLPRLPTHRISFVMEVPTMKITLDSVCATRGEWSLSARGTFSEGLHLISGNIGSGKSTLALLLSGLFSSFSGGIAMEGVMSVMVSFQFPEYQITGLTLERECTSWGLNPSTVLSSVKLYEKKDLNPLKLSRGELKRLNLACLLAGQYDLLILDEPFSSLDVQEKERVCQDLSLPEKGNYHNYHARADSVSPD